MARRKSGLSGVTKLRKTLRRLPEEVQANVRGAVNLVAEAVEADMKSGAPRAEGDLAASIQTAKSRDGLAAVVGPAAKAFKVVRRAKAKARRDGIKLQLSDRNKHLMFQLAKANWIENGTKGYPQRNIPPMPARPFIQPAVDLNSAYFEQQVRLAVRRAIEEAARD